MKRKFLLPILSICMVVALVSVGFAAWLITGNTTTGATGQFNTYGVTNKYYTVTATPAKGAAIIFGNPNGVTSDPNNWFQFNSGDESNSDKTESLTAEFTITVKTEDTNYGIEQCCEDNFTNNNITFTFSETVGKLDSVIGSNYIKAPSFAYSTNGTDYNAVSSVVGTDWRTGKSFTISKDMLNVDNVEGTATVKVKITFEWGTAFGGENPYLYFNGANFGADNSQTYATLNAKSENADTCKEIRSKATSALNALLELNGKSYNVGLEVTAAVDAGE